MTFKVCDLVIAKMLIYRGAMQNIAKGEVCLIISQQRRMTSSSLIVIGSQPNELTTFLVNNGSTFNAWTNNIDNYFDVIK